MKFTNPIFLALILASTPAYPCSSCGSGAADSIVLNPLEDQRFYLGLGQQSGFRDVDSEGRKRRDLGPDVKRQLEFAFAQRLNRGTFISVSSGLGHNEKGARKALGALDSTLNIRYTPWLQSIAEPWLPQVQFIFSHRFRTTRSVQDAQEENYLDSFGAGYQETFYGADLWFGMWPILFGGTFLRSHPYPTDTKVGRLLFGEIQREILTMGYMIYPEAKLIGGAIRERREAIQQGSHYLPDSDRRSHDLFVTMETLRADIDNFRATWTRRAAWGHNRNSVYMNTITLAWLRTL